MAWHGDVKFLYKQLILKDFKIRYRNMSLGVLWSLLNPLVMMGVLTFIFTTIFPSHQPRFPLMVLCGIIPFNFFSVAWVSGTTSVMMNAPLIKRVAMPREVLPISTVLSNVPHLLIQLGLLMVMALAYGSRPGLDWLWLIVVWTLEIVFVCGLSLIFAGLNVFIQDTRYFVESANTVLFWMVPIFYPFSAIPLRFAGIYEINPVAAIVLAMQNILLQNHAASLVLVAKLAFVSTLTIAIGHIMFRSMERNFYQHL